MSAITGREQSQQTAQLFDHLVGKCEQRVRYVEPHRPCGVQIEREHEARRLLDRQVGGFSALEDAIDQRRPTLEKLAPVRSIRHQAPFALTRLAPVTRWRPSLGSVLKYAPAIEQRNQIGDNKEGVGPLAIHRIKTLDKTARLAPARGRDDAPKPAPTPRR